MDKTDFLIVSTVIGFIALTIWYNLQPSNYNPCLDLNTTNPANLSEECREFYNVSKMKVYNASGLGIIGISVTVERGG